MVSRPSGVADGQSIDASSMQATEKPSFERVKVGRLLDVVQENACTFVGEGSVKPHENSLPCQLAMDIFIIGK